MAPLLVGALPLTDTSLPNIAPRLYRDNGKEDGNYREYRGYLGFTGYILGLYSDDGKEHGNYYIGFRVIVPLE